MDRNLFPHYEFDCILILTKNCSEISIDQTIFEELLAWSSSNYDLTVA